METKIKRSTIYLDSKLHRALKVKAAEQDRTISDLINEAISQILAEDYEDLKAFEDRKKEPSLDFESVLKELKTIGKL
jgi:predicted transcriptional regulator